MGFPRAVLGVVLVLLGFRQIDLVLLGFTGFYWVFMDCYQTYLVLLSFTGFLMACIGFTGFYWVLLGFTGFYWVLLSFNGLLSNLFGFTEFYWVLNGLYSIYWVLHGRLNRLGTESFLFCLIESFLFILSANTEC